MQETQETRFPSLGWEDPQEEEMATHSSILAWRIPWTEEPGRLQPMGKQRVGYDWAHTRFSFLLLPRRKSSCDHVHKGHMLKMEEQGIRWSLNHWWFLWASGPAMVGLLMISASIRKINPNLWKQWSQVPAGYSLTQSEQNLILVTEQT